MTIRDHFKDVTEQLDALDKRILAVYTSKRQAHLQKRMMLFSWSGTSVLMISMFFDPPYDGIGRAIGLLLVVSMMPYAIKMLKELSAAFEAIEEIPDPRDIPDDKENE